MCPCALCKVLWLREWQLGRVGTSIVNSRGDIWNYTNRIIVAGIVKRIYFIHAGDVQ